MNCVGSHCCYWAVRELLHVPTGDISATEEASGLATEGVEHRQRLQGGLLGDGTLLWLIHFAVCLIMIWQVVALTLLHSELDSLKTRVLSAAVCHAGCNSFFAALCTVRGTFVLLIPPYRFWIVCKLC